MVTEARKFAILAHGDQMYGEQPYSFHLDSVASIARRHSKEAEIIAYLHDILEDTDVKIKEIQDNFNDFFAQAVSLITDEPGRNRNERKLKTYDKLTNVTGDLEIALVVKAADRLANVKACIADNNTHLLSMYTKEHRMFKDSIYREGLCDWIWEELDGLL